MSAKELDPSRKKRRAYEAEYREKNRARLRKYSRDHTRKRDTTPKRKKQKYEWNKKYRKKNKAKVNRWARKGSATYRKKHPKKVAAIKKKYIKKNPNKNKEWKKRQ